MSTSDEPVPGLVELCRLPVSAREELLERPDGSLADPLRAVTDLRRGRPELSPALASAVIAQLGYRARGRASGSLPNSGPWLTTEVGLEQASRPVVAQRRAGTLAAAGITGVVDASAGIGMDARAFLTAGLAVVAIELDPVTVEVCRANLEQTGELLGSGGVQVECADATTPGVLEDAVASLPGPVAVFVDPARRGRTRPADGTRSRSERDRERWSPPWSFIEEVRERFEYVAVKTPPGFTPDTHWKAEWVAVGDSVVECALYSPAASASAMRQVSIADADPAWSLSFDVDATRPPARGVNSYLAELHPVARRTGALAQLCQQHSHLAPVTDASMWLSGDRPEPMSPALRWFEVLGSGSLDELASICTERGIERVALKTLESKRPQHDIRQRLGLPDGDEFAVVAVAELHEHLLVRRMRAT